MILALYFIVGIAVATQHALKHIDSESASPFLDAWLAGVFWPIAMAVRFFTK